jgi:hypothetical protein
MDISSHPLDDVDARSHPVSTEPYKVWALSSYPIDSYDYDFECPYCGCTSSDYYYMKSHIRIEHGEDDEPVQ